MKPLKFNEETEAAALDGRKTVTRRPVKPQPISEGAYFDAYNGGPQWNWWSKDNKQFLDQIIKCPYGEPGDKFKIRDQEFEITKIQVEMVQEISASDIIAEGIRVETNLNCMLTYQNGVINKFIQLWNSIYESKGFGWEVNPWVWVIEFERVG